MDAASDSLPILTPKIIERSQQGLEAARILARAGIVEASLMEAEALFVDSTQAASSPAMGFYRVWVLKTLIHTLFRVKVEHLERLPSQAAAIAPNHLGHIDPLLILAEIPPRPYYHVIGDARSLYNKAWKRLILRRSGGVIPLERRWKEELAVIEAAKAGREDLQELAEAIAQEVPDSVSIQLLRRLDRIIQGIFAHGDGIIIFPEGRLGEKEGYLHPLKRGTVIYALKAGVPIVPLAIIGTQNLYLGKELTLKFGEPLFFERDPHPKPQAIQAATEALQVALQNLLPTDYIEPPGIKLFSHFLNHLFW